MIRCKFTYQYIDFEKQEPSNFECFELLLPSGFCIFHDNEYHKEYPEIVCNRLDRKLVLGVGYILYLIGYNIPHLRVKNSFSNSVYFTKSIVAGRITFENCNFRKVDFSYAEFKEASFEQVYFLNKADFVATKISRQC